MISYKFLVTLVTLAALSILSSAQNCDLEVGESGSDYPAAAIEAAYKSNPDLVSDFLAEVSKETSVAKETSDAVVHGRVSLRPKRAATSTCPYYYKTLKKYMGCYVVFSWFPFNWTVPKTVVCWNHCPCPPWKFCRPNYYYSKWLLLLCPCYPGWEFKIAKAQIAVGPCYCRL